MEVSAEHVSVLSQEVVAALSPVAQRLIVDCTVGLGGHTAALMEATPPDVRLLGLDVDEGNLAIARSRLERFGERVRLIRSNFARLSALLEAEGELGRVDALLADLGLSSNQIANPAFGFSFERDGPLDMRLDPRTGPSAADLVNRLSERELADLLWVQSQERHSRRIARRICEARQTSRLDSTLQLARLVMEAVSRGRRGGRRLHPATKTFLALRSAVNREQESLQTLLADAPRVLRPGGRLAVISFHSMEDRPVKEGFRALAAAGVYRVLTRRPIIASEAERRSNRRCRSAKMRVAERL
jgi:16S rRNA (cytosine1402-N4)-methyltransferase